MAVMLAPDNPPGCSVMVSCGVRSTRRGRSVALRALMPMVAPEAATSWVHVARQGEWKGHRSGEFTLDAKAFRECVRNFQAQTNPIKFDYEHASLDACPAGAPAAGWVQRVEARGQDLWAFVEWTDKAADEIRAGQYRFCSCVFVFDSTDRVTAEPIGCELVMVALTDSPFIDGLTPLSI